MDTSNEDQDSARLEGLANLGSTILPWYLGLGLATIQKKKRLYSLLTKI